MAGVHVVIDGCAAIPGGAAQDYSLSIVPQNVHVGDERFHGGTDDGGAGLRALLARSQEPPRLSSPPEEDYREIYAGVLDWGVEIVSLHPPASLHESVEVARRAAAGLPDGRRVSVVETPLLGPALGLLALRAAQAGIDDLERREVLRLVDRLMPRIALRAVAADARYAEARGGLPVRLAPQAEGAIDASPEGADAAAAALPVYALSGGELILSTLAPDLGLALRGLAEVVLDSLPEEPAWHFGAFSAGADAEAAALATFLDGRRPAREAWIAACDPLLATHLGPGAFGLAWYDSV